VVREEGAEVTLEELRDFLAGRVPKWWIPEEMELIDEIPKTSVGKFSKRDLRERFAGRRAAAKR
jgi:fatty-acyl-CoA synthase